jgi:ribosomal protein S18 acetylase RimI-like enzyme
VVDVDALIMLRPATDADIAAIHALYTDPTVIPFMLHEPMSLDAFGPLYASLLDGGLMVWEVDDRIAGMYRTPIAEGRASHTAMLSTVAVHPDFQGTGVARTMLEDALDRLRARGIVRIELLAEADNVRGIAFYRKLGFEVIAVLKDAYRAYDRPGYVDDMLMSKMLR